ncbi:MAG TPA: hypothetical protein VKT72_08420, partial [Candidatus Baltobacteraceae bacterium]|nr:hypothetical protein [Candidatus Baltobacteraceae bacterium]
FPNGETLTISTSTTSGIIAVNGTLSNVAGTISTFTTDGYGSGTMTMTATGTHYPIDSWHVSSTPST